MDRALPSELHALMHIKSATSNVRNKALACGTPVVSTDCPSVPQEILVDGQFGRLVPVGDVNVLDADMAETLAAAHDRGALIARAQHFSIHKAADQYAALLFPPPAVKCIKKVRASREF